MRPKVLVVGIILVAFAALMVVVPSLLVQFGSDVGITPGSSLPVTYVVRIAPDNYSSVKYSVSQGTELTVKMGSGQQAVDFFLMNPGNFSVWSQGATNSAQVYPQSLLDVRNYTFVLPSADQPRVYYLVFVSRSTTYSADVLLDVFQKDTGAFSTLLPLPIALFLSGAVLTAYGVRGGRKEEPAEVEAAAPPAGLGGWQELLGMGGPRCKFCGAALQEGASFCPSCKRSQG